MIKISIILLLLLTLPQLTINATNEIIDTHIVNYANPTPLRQIKERYYAYDFADGDITKKLEFETNYHELTCKIGSYDLIVSVTNSKNQTTILNHQIMVRDFINPEISLKTNTISYDISIDNLCNLISENIIFTDNLDTNPHLIEYIIKENNCEFYCYDTSLNKSNTLNISLEIFESIRNEFSKTLIEVNSTSISKDEIIKTFLKENSINTNYLNATIKSNYFNTNPKNGIYGAQITFSYENYIVTYNFKIKLLLHENINSKYFYLLIFIPLIIVLLIIHKRRTNYLKH